jgi:hypothetical protein
VEGPSINLDSTMGWVTLTVNVNAPTTTLPAGYDPCDIREIDVAIQTGPTGTYSPAVVHIDNIMVAAPGSGDGGAEAGADSGPAPSDAADAPAQDVGSPDVSSPDVSTPPDAGSASDASDAAATDGARPDTATDVGATG